MVTSTLINQGVLYVVATPIGHLEDITQRAIDILATVDVIVAEDTRHSGLLLSRLAIVKPLLSLHVHNENHRCDSLLAQLQAGKRMALISDAGTPLISDPGYPLVSRARMQGIEVVPIPGPCALITALSASGLPCDRFIFEGFLPAKFAARQARLSALKQEPRTMVFYEAPHRISALVEDMQITIGAARRIVLAKELTKTFETFFSGTIDEAIVWLNDDDNHRRGEFVVILAGAEGIADDHKALKNLLVLLLDALPLKQAVKLAASYSEVNKNEVYRIALSLKDP